MVILGVLDTSNKKRSQDYLFSERANYILNMAFQTNGFLSQYKIIEKQYSDRNTPDKKMGSRKLILWSVRYSDITDTTFLWR